MLRRLTTTFVLAAALFAAGCSDQPARATGPSASPSLEISLNEIRNLINNLVPNQPYNGRAQAAFTDVAQALNTGGAVEAEALEFQELILTYYGRGVLLRFDPYTTVEEAVVGVLNAVFTYAALPHLLIPEPPNDPNVEYGLGIVSGGLVKTNFGNAALNVTHANNVLVAIIEKQSSGFPVPAAYQQIAKVFEVFASSPVEGTGTVLSICDAVGSHSGPVVFLHDIGGALPEIIPANPAITGHACPPDDQTSALRGGSFWARGLNAAGSLVESVLLPKKVYASHSLAHAIIVDELSPWSLAELIPEFTVRIVRVKTPGYNTTDFHAIFPKQGNLVLWLEISDDDVVQTCDGGRLLTDVQARPTATNGGSPTVGTWTSATRCEIVNGTSGWVFEMQNPRNNRNSSGIIDVRITGTPAVPQLTYEAKL